MPFKVYFDTDAFRHLGHAYSQVVLAPELKEHVLLDPLTAIEVLAQLCTPEAEVILNQIKAMHNWVNIEHAGILPWAADVISEVGFGVIPEYSDITDRVAQALNACFEAATAAPLEEDARRVRTLLDAVKDETLTNFQNLMGLYRQNPLAVDQHDQIWFESLRRRAGVDQTTRTPHDLKTTLGAVYTFEFNKLAEAARNPHYNAARRLNDPIDVEHLTYISVPYLKFLTCDTGYRRVTGTAQQHQIRISAPDSLRNAQTAEALLRELISL